MASFSAVSGGLSGLACLLVLPFNGMRAADFVPVGTVTCFLVLPVDGTRAADFVATAFVSFSTFTCLLVLPFNGTATADFVPTAFVPVGVVTFASLAIWLVASLVSWLASRSSFRFRLSSLRSRLPAVVVGRFW